MLLLFTMENLELVELAECGNMIKIIHSILTIWTIALIVLITAGCTDLRIIEQGINESTNRIGRASLCGMVGTYPCIIGAGISGYAEGKEKTRDKITLENLTKGDNTNDSRMQLVSDVIFYSLIVFIIYFVYRTSYLIRKTKASPDRDK